MSEAQRPAEAASPSRLERWAGGILLLYVAGLVLCRSLLGTFEYSIWGDRDLYRAWWVLRDLPVTGAELSQGSIAAVPGGIQYWLMAPVVWATADPAASYQQALAMDALALVVLGTIAWRAAGPLAAGLATSTILLMPATSSTMVVLWNPTFLPLFVALAYAGAMSLARDGERRAMLCWAFGTGVAAQLHLQGAAVGMMLLVGALFVRPRSVVRQLPWGLGVLLVLYAPYLLTELRLGGAQVSSLLEQPSVQQLSHPESFWRDAWVDVVDGASFLFGTTEGRGTVVPLAWADLLLSPVAWVGVLVLLLAPLAIVPAVRRRVPVPVALWIPAACALWCVGGVLLLDPGLYLGLARAARYLMPIVPAVGLVGAIATTRLVRGLPRGLVAVCLLALVGGRLWAGQLQAQRWRDDAAGLNQWAAFEQRLASLEERTGRPLEDLARRLLVANLHDGNWHSQAMESVDFLLAARGERFEGSATAPCYILVVHGPSGGVPVLDKVSEVLGEALPGGRFTSLGALDPTRELVQVEGEGLRCPTSLVNRYVLSEDEQQVRAIGAALEPGDVAVTSDARRWRSTTRWAEPVAWRGEVPLLLAVDVEPTPKGTVQLTLIAEALRGSSYNPGLLGSRLVRRPTVILEGKDATHRIPLAPTWLGMDGGATPITVSGIELPAPPVAVSLELELHPEYDRRSAYGTAADAPAAVTTQTALGTLPEEWSTVSPAHTSDEGTEAARTRTPKGN